MPASTADAARKPGFANWRPEPVAWRASTGLVDYEAASRRMEALAAAIAAGEAGEEVWLLEHPPLYTAGVSAKEADLLDTARFPVYRTSRGGQFTYHGPGQRVAYVMLNLKARRPDVRGFVRDLEGWLIDALALLGVAAERREGRVGVWTALPGGGEAKIAAIGVRVRRWTTFHGVSLNVRPDLSHFEGIVPCGLSDFGVTSLAALGVAADMGAADAALRRAFETRFGPAADQSPPSA